MDKIQPTIKCLKCKITLRGQTPPKTAELLHCSECKDKFWTWDENEIAVQAYWVSN